MVLFPLELTCYALNQFHNAKSTVLFREGLSSGIKPNSNKIYFTLKIFIQNQLPRGFLVSNRLSFHFITTTQFPRKDDDRIYAK